MSTTHSFMQICIVLQPWAHLKILKQRIKKLKKHFFLHGLAVNLTTILLYNCKSPFEAHRKGHSGWNNTDLKRHKALQPFYNILILPTEEKRKRECELERAFDLWLWSSKCREELEMQRGITLFPNVACLSDSW